MNITDRPDLDTLAAAAFAIWHAATHAARLIDQGQPHEAREILTQAMDKGQRIYRGLVDAGAKPVGQAGVSKTVPLQLLDTPATRRLLTALEVATAAAADVDKERGWTLADGTPFGYADTIGAQTERLRQEVEGPRSRE